MPKQIIKNNCFIYKTYLCIDYTIFAEKGFKNNEKIEKVFAYPKYPKIISFLHPATPPACFHPFFMFVIIFPITAYPKRFADGARLHFRYGGVAVSKND